MCGVDVGVEMHVYVVVLARVVVLVCAVEGVAAVHLGNELWVGLEIDARAWLKVKV